MISFSAIITLLQVVVAMGLLNVWLVRFHRATSYRGGQSKNMLEEFSVYGLPPWFCYVVGAIKILCAGLLLAGLWIPSLVFPAAATLTVLMLGALAMHAKVRDPLQKFLPALAVLVMCGTISAQSLSWTA